ncbi:MAG: DUF3857 domain-containing protein [Myxococcales bacterium]|nr:DUF3857 domain-containing protein [Myxococcales bacterium]
MSYRARLLLLLCLFLAACATVPPRPDPACPDNLVRLDGEELPGRLAGIADGQIRFVTLNGELKTYAAAQVARIDLGHRLGDPRLNRLTDLDPEIRALIADAAANPFSRDYTHAVLLLEQRRTLTRDGQMLGTYRELVQILQNAGLDEANATFSYDSRRDEARVDFGYAIAPDGKISILSSGAVRDTSLGDGRPDGSSRRQLQIALPDAEVGGFVYYQFSFRKKLDPLYTFAHGGGLAFSSPVGVARTIVRVPKDTALNIVERHLAPEVVKTDTVEGDERVIVYEARRPPVRLDEPLMPSWNVVAPYYLVAVAQPWWALAEAYAAGWNERLQPDAAVTAKARELTAGRAPREAAAALYRFVLRDIRDNGTAMWNRDPLPKPPAQTLVEALGNRIDRAALLVQLAQAAGLDAELILTENWREHLPWSEAPLLRNLSQPLVWFCFADGVAWCSLDDEDRVFGSLPDTLAGSFYLAPATCETGVTPANDEAANRATLRYDIYLDTGGGARVVEHHEWTGNFAVPWRDARQLNDKQLRDRMQNEIRDIAPRMKLESFQLSGLNDLTDPVMLDRVSTCPLLTVSGGGRYQLLRLFHLSYGELPQVEPQRQYPLETNRRYIERHLYRFHLSAGMTVRDLPAPVKIANRWSAYEGRWTRDGDGLTFASETRFFGLELPPEEFSGYEDFLRARRELAEIPLLLEKAAPEPAAAQGRKKR